MADDPTKLDFTASINKLEEINSWFQNEDFSLDEGLQKLREGKELIKKCRARLRQVENEFIQIKNDFAEEGQQGREIEVSRQVLNSQRPKHKAADGEEPSPDDVPF